MRAPDLKELKGLARRVNRARGCSDTFIGLDLIDSQTGVIDFHSCSNEAAEFGCA
jgi:hypothetical protein